MDFDVRTVGVDDRPAVRALRLDALARHPEAFGESYEAVAARDESEWRWPDSDDAAMLIAAAGDDLVGMLIVRRDAGNKSGHRAWIYGVYVKPEARSRGVGDALMKEAIARARRMDGVVQVQLSVSVATPTAQRLYERHGFRVWGREPRALYVDGRYLDERHLVLRLDDAGDQVAPNEDTTSPASSPRRE